MREGPQTTAETDGFVMWVEPPRKTEDMACDLLRTGVERKWYSMFDYSVYTYYSLQKHQDSFASVVGFFLIDYDAISLYVTTSETGFFTISDPVQWFSQDKLFLLHSHVRFKSAAGVRLFWNKIMK